ncbi:hypothetical protein [Gudongella sp. SC589]|uniref:hypothetical protein n=1 Tax=Gudongella sp. SC589 TaxID=3385990 RepID=UPI003904ADB6
MNKKNLVNEAEKIMEAEDIRHALRDLREYLMEEVALTAEAMYKSLLDASMDEERAHDIVKSYVIDMCRLRWQPGEPDYFYDDFVDFEDDDL